MPVISLTTPELIALIRHRIQRAYAGGIRHIQDADGFEAHLVGVAEHAATVAACLRLILPPSESPDPDVAFVAGAWHDAGKILHGDDYHEITSALEVLEDGERWGLVRGPRDQVTHALQRAARAIVPHFALHEQWSTTYVPTRAARAPVVPQYEQLMQALWPSPSGEQSRLLLPTTVDALVLIYSDMTAPRGCEGRSEPFDRRFERRWREISARALRDDPAIVPVLPRVRPRIEAGCALIQQFLTRGYDMDALRQFQATLDDSGAGVPVATCHRPSAGTASR